MRIQRFIDDHRVLVGHDARPLGWNAKGVFKKRVGSTSRSSGLMVYSDGRLSIAIKIFYTNHWSLVDNYGVIKLHV